MSTTKLCPEADHNYQPTGERQRLTKGADVEIWGFFYCTCCLDIQTRRIGVWKGAAKKSYNPDYQGEKPF